MSQINIQDFLNYKFLSKVKYSPNGEHACFVVSKADKENNNYKSNLWVFNTQKENCFQLTSCDKESNFIWYDNDHIMFPAVRDNKDKKKKEKGHVFTQFYKININGGEASKDISIPKSVGKIMVLNEDFFVFTAPSAIDEKELYTLQKNEKKKELKRRKEEKDYEVIDELPFWGNGLGYVNKKRRGLYLYNVNSNEITRISNKYMNVYGFELSASKDKIVFIADEYKNISSFTSKIFMYNIDSAKLEYVSTSFEDYAFTYAGFLNENEIICFGSGMRKYGMNENGKFYIVDLVTKEFKCITPDFDLSLWNSVNSDCRYGNGPTLKIHNNELYFVSAENYSTNLYKVDREGNITTLTKPLGAIDNYDVNGDNILFIGFRGLKLHELYQLNNNNEKQMTEFNEWLQAEKSVAQLEKIQVVSEESTIDGWVIKPVGYQEDKKYPAILDIHGGPKTCYGEVFVHEMQVWANKGYFVFFCNPRGSDGKGNKFADIRGKYGTIDYEDIMKFTDEVLAKYPQIDDKNVGVTGGSYGGYMTNWIIGHTDRFKAAASQRSISNWISFYNTSDIGYEFSKDQCNGNPWDNHDELWEQSPLKYANKVKTPTLFIHSEEDYRCWLPEGMQMFTALKYYGIDSRMVIFKGENHELSRSGKPKHRIRRLDEITTWFEKYLK